MGRLVLAVADLVAQQRELMQEHRLREERVARDGQRAMVGAIGRSLILLSAGWTMWHRCLSLDVLYSAWLEVLSRRVWNSFVGSWIPWVAAADGGDSFGALAAGVVGMLVLLAALMSFGYPLYAVLVLLAVVAWPVSQGAVGAVALALAAHSIVAMAADLLLAGFLPRLPQGRYLSVYAICSALSTSAVCVCLNCSASMYYCGMPPAVGG